MLSAFERWRDEGRYFIHRGNAIFWRAGGRGGTGRTLLCVHGFPTASWDWQPLWAGLEPAFARVLAADMIGFGWSAKPPAYDYSISDQADLQEALLREQDVSRYHILAHDYGDTVAQELLARHEDRAGRGDHSLVVESVCFLNGGLFPETHRARPVQKLLLSPLGPLLSRLLGEAGFGRSFSAVFGPNTKPSAEELAQFWALIRHEDGNRMMHRLLHYIPERRERRTRWVGAMQDTKVPLRVIDGPEDPVSGAHMVARYRELMPNPDTVLLPGIGHYPQVEAPEQTLAAFLGFQARLGGPGPLSLAPAARGPGQGELRRQQ